MPNWVKNVVWIESPNLEIIQQIKEFFGDLNFDNIIPTLETLNINSGSTSSLAFKVYMRLLQGNSIDDLNLMNNYIFKELPYIEDPNHPDSLFGLRSDNISYLYKYPKDQNDYKTKDPKCRGDFFMLGRIQYINLIKYGSKDWYDFCNANWGTKWSANYNWDEEEAKNWYKEFYNNGIYMIRYEFRTAWSFPYGIYDEFLFQFGYRKDIKFNIQWADEDFCSYNQGWGLKDYNQMAFNCYQLTPICIRDDREKFSAMLWSYIDENEEDNMNAKKY